MKLKPCPFCGRTEMNQFWDIQLPDGTREGFNIICFCGQAQAYSTYQIDAVVKWNARKAYKEEP